MKRRKIIFIALTTLLMSCRSKLEFEAIGSNGETITFRINGVKSKNYSIGTEVALYQEYLFTEWVALDNAHLYSDTTFIPKNIPIELAKYSSTIRKAVITNIKEIL